MFHCETVQANIDLKFEVLFPIHWSKLDLSINPQDEPIIRIIKKNSQRISNIAAIIIGEVFDLH
jgi:hypothetical protein